MVTLISATLEPQAVSTTVQTTAEQEMMMVIMIMMKMTMEYLFMLFVMMVPLSIVTLMSQVVPNTLNNSVMMIMETTVVQMEEMAMV